MRNIHNGHHHHHYDPHCDQQQCHGELIPELAGAIFMCNNETRDECFTRRILGLPACRESFVRQVKDGMFLFLFDTNDRKMFGVFKATSDGGMNIVPEAYKSSSSTFPAQVQFEIISKCKPLSEPEFKSAILRNYFTDIKFNFGLNYDQVQRLLDLFEEKKVRRVPQSIRDRCGPSSSDLPVKRRYAYQECGSMSSTDTLSQTIHKCIRNTNPNTEAAQQKAQVVYCTGTSNYLVCAQKMVPDMAYNSCLLCQTPCGIHVDPDDQRNTLSAHNHPNLSPSQAAQRDATYPSFPENIKMTVGTCSDFYGDSRLQDQVHNSGSQDVEQKKSVFLRLGRNPQRKTWETESCRKRAYSTMDQPSHRMQTSSHQTGSRPARQHSPVYSKPAVQYQELRCTNRMTGRYTDAAPDTAMEVDGIDLDPTAPVSNSVLCPGETQIPIVNFKRRNVGGKLDTELKGGLKKRRIIPFKSQPVNAYSEAEPDPDVVDGMEVHPITSSTNSTVEHSETQIPFVNFNRRNRVRNLGTEPQGDNKKRKLIRPSLELEGSSHLQVLEGHLQAAINLNEPMNKPSLVSTESGLDGKSMLITDNMDVDARVGSKNLELLQGFICNSMGTEVEVVDTALEQLQGNHEGERVLFNGLGIETERGNPDLGTSIRAGSFVTMLDQQQDESNEILVSIENDSEKLNLDLKESKVFPFTSNICLDKLPDISKVETGHVAQTKSEDPQMIPISGPENSDASQFNESGANLFEDQTELLVIEKRDKKKPVSNPDPIQSKPMTQIKENNILEHEPTNPKVSLYLYNEESNLVEACINLDPKANNLETSLVSRTANCDTVEDYIALEPEADLEMFMFSFSQNSIPVEDYIALE